MTNRRLRKYRNCVRVQSWTRDQIRHYTYFKATTEGLSSVVASAHYALRNALYKCSTYLLTLLTICSTPDVLANRKNIQHRPVLLWRFRDSGAVYKTADLLTYLLWTTGRCQTEKSGRGKNSSQSKRPGRRRAESTWSMRLVAPMT